MIINFSFQVPSELTQCGKPSQTKPFLIHFVVVLPLTPDSHRNSFSLHGLDIQLCRSSSSSELSGQSRS